MTMDITTIVAIASVVVANIGTTIILFTWATSHAANDSRENRRIIEEMGNKTDRLIEAIRLDMKQFQEEMKEFHGRICTIEERRKS